MREGQCPALLAPVPSPQGQGSSPHRPSPLLALILEEPQWLPHCLCLAGLTNTSLALREGCVDAVPLSGSRGSRQESHTAPSRSPCYCGSELLPPTRARPTQKPSVDLKCRLFSWPGPVSVLVGCLHTPWRCCSRSRPRSVASRSPLACMHAYYIHVYPMPHTHEVPQAHISDTSLPLTHVHSWVHCMSASCPVQGHQCRTLPPCSTFSPGNRDLRPLRGDGGRWWLAGQLQPSGHRRMDIWLSRGLDVA